MEELDILISNAQAGHRDARETIIQRLRPLVVKTAASLGGRYIDPGNDEMSIGLLAINQAIDSYQPEGGAAFISFAELIVKRRLIDYYRREKHQQKVIPFSSLGGEEPGESNRTLEEIEHQQAESEFQQCQEQEERRDEIRSFVGQLKNFGITFNELVACSPKHEDARLRAMEVARLVAEHEELIRHLHMKKELPLKLIESMASVSRKTLERQRKYIIAMVLVFSGDYRYLRSYINKAL